ncbi:MAG: zinc-ribbon domain-containing protein [candidate division WOR-3 bacterium]
MESQELNELRELLEQKREIKARLDKLRSLKDKTKPTVFKKVYEDYNARLEKLNSVIEQKKETVRRLYSQYEKAKIGYLKEKSAHEDELEEAKLRYMVGEYEESVFRELEKEKRIEIESIKEKVKELDEKMRFLKEILEEKEVIKEVKTPEVSVKKSPPSPPAEEAIEELEELESILEESLKPIPEEKPKKKEKEEFLVEEKFMDELGKGEEKKKTIICPKCGHENPPDSYFCEECGTELIPEDIEI